MNEPQPPARPERTADVLRGVAGLLFAGLVITAVLIAAGTFDPQPLGPLLRRDEPGTHTLPAAGETTIAQSPPWSPAAAPDRFSVRLTAALADGETDSGYGLALGDGTNRLLVAVSPLGYATVREEDGGDLVYHIPWQTWPHVQPGTGENEIWLDVEQTTTGTELTARVNRELLWRGVLDWTPNGVDLWLGSFGGPITVDSRSLEWFDAPDD